MTVYIDLLFLLNLTANYFLLLSAGRIVGAGLERWRIALGGGLGALYAVLIFLPGLGWLTGWPCRLAAGVLMVLTAFGGERRLLRVTLVFFGVSAALAGAVLGVELLGGPALLAGGVYYTPLDVRLLLLVFAAGYFALSLLFRWTTGGGGGLVRLEIDLEDGTAALSALVDTGHTLIDPATNRPVVVADWRALSGVIPAWADPAEPVRSLERGHALGQRQARLVPYRAVGVDHGLLLALRARQVKLNGRPLGRLLVALSPTPLDGGGGYQALVGGM